MDSTELYARFLAGDEAALTELIGRYREGLTRIDESNREELSNVSQWAAPTVNNGVVVSLDSGSAWTLTGTCYITGLTLADGAVLKAAGGKRLSMTVDGVETPVQSGAYIGKIVLSVS